jgi:hypothetical protein
MSTAGLMALKLRLEAAFAESERLRVTLDALRTEFETRKLCRGKHTRPVGKSDTDT